MIAAVGAKNARNPTRKPVTERLCGQLHDGPRDQDYGPGNACRCLVRDFPHPRAQRSEQSGDVPLSCRGDLDAAILRVVQEDESRAQ